MKLHRSSPGKELEVLLSGTVAERKLPANLKQADYTLFSHELEKVIPPAKLLEFRNLWISSDGFLFKGRRILLESFAFPFLFDNWKKRRIVKFFATNYLFRKRRRFEKAAVWIVDDWSGGYFHWLADALTRLYTIKDRLDDFVLLLPYTYRGLEFVRATLKAFNVHHVEFIDPTEVLFCGKLIVPMHTAPSGHYNDGTIRGVRDLLLEFYGNTADSETGGRVYISRRGAPKRRIVNEEEVIAVLREFDFRIIRSEEYSFEQQVKIAACARYLVSNHGAGLTNMLFMREGSNILELRHVTDCINNCYFTLASALSHDYFYQTCKPQTPGEDAHTADLIVDAQALRENLGLMLTSSK